MVGFGCVYEGMWKWMGGGMGGREREREKDRARERESCTKQTQTTTYYNGMQRQLLLKLKLNNWYANKQLNKHKTQTTNYLFVALSSTGVTFELNRDSK